METPGILAAIARGSIDFLVSVLALSLLIALLLQTTGDTGIRAWFNHRWIRAWLAARIHKYPPPPSPVPRAPSSSESDPYDEVRRLGSRVFDLTPSRLCGQLSAHLQSLLVQQRPSSLLDALDPVRPEPVGTDVGARLARIEQAIDDLQLNLQWRWRMFDYAAALLLVMLFLVLSGRWIRQANVDLGSIPVTLIMSVSIVAALLVPQMRIALDRLLASRG